MPKKKTETYSIPTEGFIRESQIIGNKEKGIPPIIPVGRTTWLNGVETGIYPKPVKLSERCKAYRVEDIRALIKKLGGTAQK